MSMAVTFQPERESALASAEPKTPQPTTIAFLFLKPGIAASSPVLARGPFQRLPSLGTPA